jgi:flagellar biosynthesis component FlhA
MTAQTALKPSESAGPRGAAAAAGTARIFGLDALGELGVPVAVLAIVLAMIVPLPSILLDLLISGNVALAVVVLMVSMYIQRPSEFSVFPTALLLLTLFRLALNISSKLLATSWSAAIMSSASSSFWC